MREDREGFGRALATARKSRHLSQAALGRLLGTNVQSAVSAWEKGKTTPDRATVFKLEKIFDMEPGYLSSYLGYRPETDTNRPRTPRTPECIQNDPDLDNYERGLLMALYAEITSHRHPEGRRPRRPRPSSE